MILLNNPVEELPIYVEEIDGYPGHFAITSKISGTRICRLITKRGPCGDFTRPCRCYNVTSLKNGNCPCAPNELAPIVLVQSNETPIR